MTKEQLLNIVKAYSNDTSDNIIHDLYEFFESNVVIPKGENRHPYADVLHEWIEGAEIEVNLNGVWSDYMCGREYIDKYVYRIKPPEPVYEWQWLHMSKTSNECRGVTTEFFTDTEVDDGIYRWIKIEETKRERK